MEAIEQQGIFKSAYEAVVFACNFSSQQYALSPMAKILRQGAYGSGRDLIGLDGAAQSGMVLAELQRLDYVRMLTLVARTAPIKDECTCNHACCSGWVVNPARRDAVSQLTDVIIVALDTGVSNRRYREAAVSRYFGEKLKLAEVAERLDIPKRTAERYAMDIRRYLDGLEKAAWTELNERLDEIGMLLPCE
ncbi:hypothetical protein AAGS40_23335 [Paraburkholderia sp. PREW-6R]|uniref:hypothetical protein n=1 Tax=Paraburkholderia sp. PREW-6R TaxID=3141544 RepID=UPI0031F49DC3